jgi:hypothetical protein
LGLELQLVVGLEEELVVELVVVELVVELVVGLEEELVVVVVEDNKWFC